MCARMNSKERLELDFAKHFEEKGYVFLGWAEVGWAYIFSKEESKNLEDLKKVPDLGREIESKKDRLEFVTGQK